MVSTARAPLGARYLRPLNTPAPIRVLADPAGQPLAVQRRGWPQPCPVSSIQDRWRIDDEWWRERPVARLYHVLLLQDDTLLTVYQDLTQNTWFEQRG